MPAEKADERIAATVRAEAARRKITQTAIGAHLGLTQPGISRRMLGRVPFSAAELAAVADLLGLPVSELVGEAVA